MTGAEGFDFLIVCCSNLAAENYWQTRLEATVKEVTGAAGTVLLRRPRSCCGCSMRSRTRARWCCRSLSGCWTAWA